MLGFVGVGSSGFGSLSVYKKLTCFGIWLLASICDSIDMRGLERSRYISLPTHCSSIVRVTYLIPTPPATNTTLFKRLTSTPGGGHTKLPPTLTFNSVSRIFFSSCHSHAAGGLRGDCCIANSMKPLWLSVREGAASRGIDVIVNPPALGRPGI